MAGGYLIVFVDGGLGAALRHGVNPASLPYFGPNFPHGTLFVNITGGLLMGGMDRDSFDNRAGCQREKFPSAFSIPEASCRRSF